MNSLDDVRRFISDCACRLDPSCYDLNFSDLCDEVSRDYVAHVREKYDWSYGDDAPEMGEGEFWELFEPYEK